MSAIRLSVQCLALNLPDHRLEVWGDNTVWIVSPEGHRERLLQFLHRRVGLPFSETKGTS